MIKRHSSTILSTNWKCQPHHISRVDTAWDRHADTQNSDMTRHGTYSHDRNKHVMTRDIWNMTRQTSGTKFLKIFHTHVPTSWEHVKQNGTKFLSICCTHVPTSWRHVRNLCPSSAKSICYFSVCHWVFSQGKAQHTTTEARAGGGATPGARAPVVVVCWALAEYSMANRKIAYILGRGRAYIFDQKLAKPATDPSCSGG